jgi:hypothetical protein
VDNLNDIEDQQNEDVEPVQDWLAKQDLSKLDPTKLNPLTEEVSFLRKRLLFEYDVLAIIVVIHEKGCQI